MHRLLPGSLPWFGRRDNIVGQALPKAVQSIQFGVLLVQAFTERGALFLFLLERIVINFEIHALAIESHGLLIPDKLLHGDLAIIYKFELGLVILYLAIQLKC